MSDQDFESRYRDALRSFLADGGEAALVMAYRLGREALETGAGVLDVAGAHGQALADAVSDAEDGPGAMAAGAAFLSEVLAPFEMTHRGFREANEMLRRLNETLEQRVSEQTRVLRESEQRFRALIENALDVVTIMDDDGTIRYVSPSVEESLGHPPPELIGRNVREFIHQEDQAAVEVLLRAGATPAPVEFRFRRKDGSWRYLEAVANNLVADPEVSGVIAISRDVTDRKSAEEAMEESVSALQETDAQRRALLAHLVHAQEEERRRIAADIHDDTIQGMIAVGMRVGGLRRQLTDPEQGPVLERLERTVQESVNRLRNLMFELHPPALDRDGLEQALRSYLDQVEPERPIRYRLDSRLSPEPALETRTVLFRIAQEALSNVRKHAGGALVHLVLERRDGGIYAAVRDDGDGFSPDELGAPKPHHLGFTSMRERAEMAGGWWRVSSVPGEGTMVEFWVPDETTGNREPD